MTESLAGTDKSCAWPELPPLADWVETCRTLHLWTQIVGKVRLTQTPWINHSWHVTLYPTSRGLTTSPIPHGERSFQIDFDFIDHRLVVATAEGQREILPLRPRSVADFYGELMSVLAGLGLPVRIVAVPNEVEPAIPFADDTRNASYDPDAANRFWRALLSSSRVLQRFRSRFLGKCSPVHVFWGGFDLAVTRFSGRPAPPHPGGVPHLPDRVAREAYTHEVSSAGFWPGTPGGPVAEASYYAYAYPEPEGFGAAPVRPEGAYYSKDLREWLLPYEAVRRADDPERTLLDFLQTTYEAAADLGAWDRQRLERPEGPP